MATTPAVPGSIDLSPDNQNSNQNQVIQTPNSNRASNESHQSEGMRTTILQLDTEMIMIRLAIQCIIFPLATRSYCYASELKVLETIPPPYRSTSIPEAAITLFLLLLCFLGQRTARGILNVGDFQEDHYADENVNEISDADASSSSQAEDCLADEFTQESNEDALKEKSKKDANSGNEDELSAILNYIQPDQWTKPPGTHIQVYTVPRFPENHNPLLPLSLQRNLDEMGPREFLTYVLNKLTLEERESLMVDERQRRKTFQVSWPYDGNRSGIKMAQAGFYSVNDYDRVQCVFCRGSLHRWEQEDIPMLEHARSFGFCRFVKGLNCGNREYRSEKLSGDDLKNISMFNIAETDRYHRRGTISVDSTTLGISTSRAAHIEYATEPSRLRTYNRWPTTSALTKERLCPAGFYYTGFDDQVRCFYCSGGLREWRITDDPWEEHARWFPDCAFLLQQKGQDYIEKVHASTPANKKCVRKTVAQKKAEAVKKQALTSQDMMYEVCQHLEYTDEQIKAAINYHGGPFNDIKELIEVKYRIENGEISVPDNSHKRNQNQRPDIAEDDIARALEVDNNPPRPGQMLASEQQRSYENACVLCERKTGRYVPACRVSLPCGHLTLCESCNTDEVAKASNTNNSPKCAKCQGQLTGTMKVYFA